MPIPIHGVVGSAFVGGLIRVTGGGMQLGGGSDSPHNQTYRPLVSCECRGTLGRRMFMWESAAPMRSTGARWSEPPTPSTPRQARRSSASVARASPPSRSGMMVSSRTATLWRSTWYSSVSVVAPAGLKFHC